MMKNEIQLSIALTTFNHEKFIAQALDSILSQKVNFTFEIVIGEDLSTDATLDIVQKYQAKHPHLIKILTRTKNLGYTSNFDDTLQQCTGKYIAIFDGDDIMKPDKLQKQFDFLERNTDFVMVGHVVKAFETDSGKINRTIEPTKKKPYYTIEDLIYYGSFFANSSKMFLRSAYPKDGIDKRIKYIADWAVTLDIVGDKKIGFIWESLSLYRIHNNSIMNTLKGADDFKDKCLIIDKINKEYKNKYKSLFKNQWAYAYFIYGIDELNSTNSISARKYFLKSLSYNMFYSLSPYFYFIISFLSKKTQTSFIKFIKNK